MFFMCAKFSHFSIACNPILRVFMYPVCGIKVNFRWVLLNIKAYWGKSLNWKRPEENDFRGVSSFVDSNKVGQCFKIIVDQKPGNDELRDCAENKTDK
jgi:hypothetical protein